MQRIILSAVISLSYSVAFTQKDTAYLFVQKIEKLNLQPQAEVADAASILPMLFTVDMWMDGNSKLGAQLSSEDVPLTNRLLFSMMINTDREYMFGFRYILTKYISLSTRYDSYRGMGMGFTLKI